MCTYSFLLYFAKPNPYQGRGKLYLHHFPDGTLTVPQLVRFLDSLGTKTSSLILLCWTLPWKWCSTKRTCMLDVWQSICVNESSKQRWMFPCKQWFDIIQGDKKTKRVLESGAKGTTTFQVKVTTGKAFGAGTNANVFITIHGKKDKQIGPCCRWPCRPFWRWSNRYFCAGERWSWRASSNCNSITLVLVVIGF